MSDAGGIEAGIQKRLTALYSERDDLNERINKLERGLVLVKEGFGTAPVKRGSKRTKAKGIKVVTPDEAIEQMEAVLTSAWISSGALAVSAGLAPGQGRLALARLQRTGTAEHNGERAKSSRWRRNPTRAKRAAKATAAAAKLTSVKPTEPVEVIERARVVVGSEDEPSEGSDRAMALKEVRAAGARGLVRKDLQEALGCDGQKQRNLVWALVQKGLVRVEGEKGEQRVIATTLRFRVAEEAPAEKPLPSRMAEIDAADEDDAPAPPPRRVTPPVPKTAPPVVLRKAEPAVPAGVPGVKLPPAPPPEPEAKVAPAPAAPRTFFLQDAPKAAKSAKAIPAEAERRTVKLPFVTDRKDRFPCKPLGGPILAGTCLDQQEIAQADVRGSGPMADAAKAMKAKFVTTCSNCSDGKQVRANVR